MPRAPATVAAFAIAAPGLEPIVALELDRLGCVPTIEPGGVSWTGTMESVVRANLWLRTASRVIVRVARFRAREFWELERQARNVSWERFVGPGAAVRFRVTARKSRLYHSDAVAQRLADAAARRTGATRDDASAPQALAAGTRGEAGGYDDDDGGAQLFVVRLMRDVCTISADTSGALLHRRGYRQAVAKAPLRETIAAAMLLGSGWPGDVPLVDPMCGSGTIPIEAALITRRIAPGLKREFACQRWPEFDADGWARVVAAAKAQELPGSPAAIQGSDRDAGAVAAARTNAERAGVASDIEFDRRSLSAIEAPAGRGWLVTNPPYGDRVGESGSLRDLYAALGNVLRARFEGWTVAVLSPGGTLERQIGLDLRERFATLNGGIRVRLAVGETGG